MEPSANLYLVGGGIAALAAAAYSIRSGAVHGQNIIIFEQTSVLGGSLDGSGEPQTGYVIRGGRMFEKHFGCTFDLFSQIPSLSRSGHSIYEDIAEFTEQIVPSSNCRLVIDGVRHEAPPFGLSLAQRWALVRLTSKSERALDGLAIEDYFDESFFSSPFWIMWCTMFAFQPWHSLIEMRRYMRRFIHLLPGFNRLQGIWRTPLNQYDSLVRPLAHWLTEQGVQIRLNSQVVDVKFSRSGANIKAKSVAVANSAGTQHIDIGQDDNLIITLGSMTADSALGTTENAAIAVPQPTDGAWGLWQRISQVDNQFGNPGAFCDTPELSTWNSFTVTSDDPYFFEWMARFTHNQAGTGGLVTLPQSSWLMSVVLAYQPHFTGQPDNITVFWGYGLRPNESGDFVGKTMAQCNGREILVELCEHLRVDDPERVLRSSICRPCAMPYITSQFMPRRPGDRPAVKPNGATNFAFLGQFTELEEDTVFTVEYSVRSAQTAVKELLCKEQPITPMYKGWKNPLVQLKALWTLCVH